MVDANFEPSRAPIYESDDPLFHLLGGDDDVTWLYFASVQHANGHVLATFDVAFEHLVTGLEALLGQVLDPEVGVTAVGHRLERGVGYEREVDSGVRNQVRLKFGHVHV